LLVNVSAGSVSVVVPTKNRCALLSLTLSTVLWQRDVDLEVIVVDEASSDDTPTMLHALDDKRVRVIRHEKSLGVAAARNRGAFEATGEWLAFVDDDDLWAPDKLKLQIRAAQSSGSDWVYAGSVTITDHGEIVYGRPPLEPPAIMAAIPRYNAVPGGGSNVMVRRAAWMRAGPFDIRLRNTEDWEMWIRLAKLGPPAYVRRPLVAYRVHSLNSSLDIAEIVRGTKLIEELHRTTADWGVVHRWLAESCLRSGQRLEALGQFAKAAVRGQVRNVAADLSTIFRRRLGRIIPQLRAERGLSRSSWISEAAVWLRELETAMPEHRATA
jgi:glycosyltransferase involved in cell wall biosynthesis